MLRKRDISLAELRELLLCPPPASTEKTQEVLKNAGLETEKKNPEGSSPSKEKPARPGHGRHAAAVYRGATKVRIAHSTLHSGDRCPGCCKLKFQIGSDSILLIYREIVQKFSCQLLATD